MTRLTRRRALGAAGMLAAGALAASTALGTTAQASGGSGRPAPVDLQILSFNDYHGQIEPTAGSGASLPGVTGAYGGGEYLATTLATLRAGKRNSLTVAAGDLIGATPITSALFKDEPTIDSLEAMGLDASGVGNHEFDEGVDELLRIQYGGCHPVDGCFDEDGYDGADFPYLAANVTWNKGVKAPRPAKGYGRWFDFRTGRTILPPTWVTEVDRVKVGFIGMTLEGTPEIVAAAGIKDVTFRDEVESARRAAKDLRDRGVRAIVVLLHEGGFPPSGAAYDFPCTGATGAAAISGPIVQIAQQLDPSIDLVVTGHTHQPYTCTIPDPAGNPRQVTSAMAQGRLVTETNLQLDRRTKDVVRSSVTSVNRPVAQTVAKDPAQTAILSKWSALAAPIANTPVASLAPGTSIVRGPRNAESGLANLIADAQLADTQVAGAQVALMNPGGVRNDLLFPSSPAGEGDGVITYGEAFAVQPFGNTLVTMTLTGAQLETALEQQWTTQTDGSVRFLALGVSDSLRYAWSAAGPVGGKVDPASVTVGGAPLDLAATYRVTVNSFLADGGDGFTVLREGTDRVGGRVDVDAFVDHLAATSPVTDPGTGRVSELP